MLKISIVVLFILISNFQIIQKNETKSSTTTYDNFVTHSTPKNGLVNWLLMFYLDGDHQYEHAIIDAMNELEAGYSITGVIEVS